MSKKYFYRTTWNTKPLTLSEAASSSSSSPSTTFMVEFKAYLGYPRCLSPEEKEDYPLKHDTGKYFVPSEVLMDDNKAKDALKVLLDSSKFIPPLPCLTKDLTEKCQTLINHNSRFGYCYIGLFVDVSTFIIEEDHDPMSEEDQDTSSEEFEDEDSFSDEDEDEDEDEDSSSDEEEDDDSSSDEDEDEDEDSSSDEEEDDDSSLDEDEDEDEKVDYDEEEDHYDEEEEEEDDDDEDGGN